MGFSVKKIVLYLVPKFKTRGMRTINLRQNLLGIGMICAIAFAAFFSGYEDRPQVVFFLFLASSFVIPVALSHYHMNTGGVVATNMLFGLLLTFFGFFFEHTLRYVFLCEAVAIMGILISLFYFAPKR